jgi:hypothetical protein
VNQAGSCLWLTAEFSGEIDGDSVFFRGIGGDAAPTFFGLRSGTRVAINKLNIEGLLATPLFFLLRFAMVSG